MNRVKLAVLAGGALFATPAFAQDTTDPTAGATEAGAEMPGDPNAATPGTEGMTDTNAAIVAGTAFWPQAAIDRPYVRPKGTITAGADFSLLSISIQDPITMTSASATVDYFTVNGTYGVTDQIAVGGLYAFSLGLGDGDLEMAGPFTLWGGYQVSHTPKLSIAATAAYTVNLNDTDEMQIQAGLGAKYLVTPKIAVFTGNAYGPGPVGNHLTIGLGDPAPMTFDVPVGAMFQATPQLNIFANTALAHFAINDDAGDSAFFGADYIPLGVGGLFALNKNLDIAASFSLFDLKEVGFDIYTFSVGARWYN